MKKIRYVFAVILVLSMMFLCACSGSSDEKTTETPKTTAAATEEESTEAPTEVKDVYQILVVDESGNPIAGAMVQMCLETCFPGVTNSEGIVEFDLADADYKVTFMSVPAGYTYSSDDTEFHFESGSKEMTIVLKKAK